MNYYGMSDCGLVRKQNQDSFFCTENKNQELLAVVCDGIGGGKAGDVASQLAVKILSERFALKPLGASDADEIAWIEASIKEANDAIYLDSLTSRSKQGMGTTLVGVLINTLGTYVFHLGDSRVYGYYDEFVCLTEDHNLAADLIKSGELSELEAINHPKGKALTNALGIWNKYIVDINKIRSDFRYLMLCSDGLHGFVSEEIIMRIMMDETKRLSSKVKLMIEAANNSGGYDNTTVILIEGGKSNG